jgi:uncharacterized membrane protein YfhO
MEENIYLNGNTSAPDKYTHTPSGYPDFSGENEYSRYTAVIDFPINDPAKSYYNKNGYVLYIPSDFKYVNKTDIYLVTTDNKIITYDNHNDTNYSTDWSDKKWRAFYVHSDYSYDSNGELIPVGNAPELRRIVFVSRNYELPRYTYFYVDNFDNYKARLDTFKQHPIEDIYYTTNTFKFKTNFDKNRFIVTQLPYESGWTVKIKDSLGKEYETDIYQSHGGFVSFVSGKGECSYEMTFYPPGLRLGGYLSAIGAASLLGTMLAYCYVNIHLKDYKKIYSSIAIL